MNFFTAHPGIAGMVYPAIFLTQFMPAAFFHFAQPSLPTSTRHAAQVAGHHLQTMANPPWAFACRRQLDHRKRGDGPASSRRPTPFSISRGVCGGRSGKQGSSTDLAMPSLWTFSP